MNSEVDRWYFGCRYNLNFDPDSDIFINPRLFRTRNNFEQNFPEVEYFEKLISIDIQTFTFTVFDDDAGKLPVDGEYALISWTGNETYSKMVVKGNAVSIINPSTGHGVLHTIDMLQSRSGG